jgi:hypothetical protein
MSNVMINEFIDAVSKKYGSATLQDYATVRKVFKESDVDGFLTRNYSVLQSHPLSYAIKNVSQYLATR